MAGGALGVEELLAPGRRFARGRGGFVGLEGLDEAVVVLALEREDYNRFIEAFKAYEAPAPASEPAARGQQLFNAQCAACHTVKGTPARGVIGPDLSLFGMRTTLGSGVWDNTPENLKRWIKDSSAMKPSSKMPPFTQLSDTDLEALAAYLYSLKLDGFDFAQLPRY